MNQMIKLTIDDYLEVVKLAKKNGKKSGESMQDELNQVVKAKNIKPLGNTELDVDLLCGELREMGLKILNISEMNRRATLDKE